MSNPCEIPALGVKSGVRYASSALLLVLALSWPMVGRAQSDPLAPAAEHVALHDYDAALPLLAALPEAERNRPASRYLHARVLEATGDLEAAAERYDISEGLPEAQLLDALARRARIQVRLGQCEAARPNLVTLGRGRSRQAAVMRALAAECLLQLGQHSEAIEALRAVAEDDAALVDTTAVRFQLAEALHASGDQAGAIAELQDLYDTRADHPDIELAREQLIGWGAQTTTGVTSRLARARRLYRTRNYDKAIRALGSERPTERGDARRWLHLRGMSLYKTRQRYDEAAGVLAECARYPGETVGECGFHAARALSRSDHDAEAIRAYRRFARSHPTDERAGLATYLAAWLSIRLGQPGGPAAMQRFVDSPLGGANPNQRAQGLWHLGFSAYQQGEPQRAERLLTQYTRASGASMDRLRGRYWVARSKELLNRRSQAVRAYRQLIASDPLHWYGYMAAMRLRALDEDPGIPHGGVAIPAAAQREEVVLPDSVALYWRLGLRADARAELRKREEDVLDNDDGGNVGLRRLLAAYAQVDDANRPFRLVWDSARPLVQGPPSPESAWAWRAAFPRPWPEAMERASSQHNVPAEYLYGIMKQESRFSQEVVSYAGAIGLMQLMPATAQAVAARLGVPVSNDRLFLPDENIRMGAALSEELLTEFNGQAPLAIAAYNAGSHRVRAWLAEGERDIDLYVDRIPIDQTRNYVRRVMTHYLHYRYLQDPSTAWDAGVAPRVSEAASIASNRDQ